MAVVITLVTVTRTGFLAMVIWRLVSMSSLNTYQSKPFLTTRPVGNSSTHCGGQRRLASSVTCVEVSKCSMSSSRRNSPSMGWGMLLKNSSKPAGWQTCGSRALLGHPCTVVCFRKGHLMQEVFWLWRTRRGHQPLLLMLMLKGLSLTQILTPVPLLSQ